MTTLPWILFALAVAWHFFSLRLSIRRRIHLENYVVYLLMSDGIRQQHKADFERWIVQAKSPDALALSSAAHRVIDNMAERLGAGDPAIAASASILGAHAMIWQFKKGANSGGAGQGDDLKR